MINLVTKNPQSSNYKPRRFLTLFILILSVFFLIASLAIVNENYKEHRKLILIEKNEEMDILYSFLTTSPDAPSETQMRYIEIWVQGHSEISRISIIDSGGRVVRVFENNLEKKSTLTLKRSLRLASAGDIVLAADFSLEQHESNFTTLAVELFFISLLIAIAFGVILYGLIYKGAISPLQKNFINEYNINETILSNLGLGIALIDKDMSVLKANDLIRQWYREFSGKDFTICYTCQNTRGDQICQDCPAVKTFKDGRVHETNRSIIVGGEIVFQRIMTYPVLSGNDVAQVIEIVEDITARVSEEQKLHRAYRVQKILSQCIQVLIHSENETTLLQNICQIIVDSGDYKLAWIALCDYNDKSVNSVAAAGEYPDFTSKINLKFDDSIYANNPVSQAIKTNSPQSVQDLEQDNSFYWGEESHFKKFNSILCIPLRDEHRVIGTLNICSDLKYVFHEEEASLFTRLADEISYGMRFFKAQKESRSLMESNFSLKQDRDVAEIANRKKSDFLAMITHEIRTPLTGILGLTELLLRGSLNAEQAKYLNIIKSTANLQMHIINDILDLSKIENGKLILEKSEFHLPQLIEEVTRSFEWQILEKKLKMSVSFDAGLPEKFSGDSLRIKQIFFNLVGNAVKFTESGAITVLVEKKFQDQQICKLKFTIIDSGIGIPRDKQSKIFESYMQADSTITKKYGGTGLGTTITKRLVELMGGSIGLQSPARPREGVADPKSPGSEFWFILELPVAGNTVDEGNLSEQQLMIEMEARAKHSGIRARILVAEDNEVNQTLIRVMLERLNHDVDIVKNGFDAIDMVKKKQYDFIFMDIEMPELNGLETAKIMRTELNISIPIIALTANAYSEDIKSYLEAGMDDIISKPYTQSEIISRIDKWFFAKTGKG